MANQFMPEKEVLKLKQEYPPGTRIVLNYMDDKWAVPPGTRGTVDHVDDAGQIHPKWDNGRTLAIVPEVDMFSVPRGYTDGFYQWCKQTIRMPPTLSCSLIRKR